MNTKLIFTLKEKKVDSHYMLYFKIHYMDQRFLRKTFYHPELLVESRLHPELAKHTIYLEGVRKETFADRRFSNASERRAYKEKMLRVLKVWASSWFKDNDKKTISNVYEF